MGKCILKRREEKRFEKHHFEEFAHFCSNVSTVGAGYNDHYGTRAIWSAQAAGLLYSAIEKHQKSRVGVSKHNREEEAFMNPQARATLMGGKFKLQEL